MKKIALLTGGPGYEREVAMKSVQLFEEYLKIPYEKFILPEQLDEFLKKKNDFDFVIPVFHGEYGEDGKISAFLDILGLPYAFSSHEVHAFCLNKFLTNTFLANLGVNVAQQLLVDEHEIHQKSSEEICSDNVDKLNSIGFPMIFKPTHGGSSFYTYKLSSKEDLKERLDEVRGKIQDSILLQEFITGEEYSVGIVDGIALQAIMKVKKDSNQVFDYTLKYEDDIETFPEIESSLRQELLGITEAIYRYLWISGCSRIDYIVRGGIPYFLEVNTIPGMTSVSILPKMWKKEGKTLEEFIEILIFQKQ